MQSVIEKIIGVAADGTRIPIVPPPPPDPWTPALLADSRGWWPADSIVLTVGSAITSLASSAGITNTLSQATAANKPLYVLVDSDPELPAMDFDGVNDLLTMSDHTISNGASAITVCVLFRLDAIATDSGPKGFLTIPTADNSATRFFFGLQGIAGANKNYGFSSKATDATGTVNNWSTTLADLNMHVAVATMDRGVNPTKIDIWLDGTSVMNTTSIVANGTWDATNEAGSNIGDKFSYASNQGVDGKILDIVVLDATLSTDNRQKVEGFMAWKGKIEGQLPIGHPYKDAPPYLS